MAHRAEEGSKGISPKGVCRKFGTDGQRVLKLNPCDQIEWGVTYCRLHNIVIGDDQRSLQGLKGPSRPRRHLKWSEEPLLRGSQNHKAEWPAGSVSMYCISIGYNNAFRKHRA